MGEGALLSGRFVLEEMGGKSISQGEELGFHMIWAHKKSL